MSGRRTNVSEMDTAIAADRGSDGVIVETDIDPNEPTYCVCDKPSFGEMIGKIS